MRRAAGFPSNHQGVTAARQSYLITTDAHPNTLRATFASTPQ
jgi:hypothetical protein